MFSEITTSYYELAQLHHPDHGGDQARLSLIRCKVNPSAGSGRFGDQLPIKPRVTLYRQVSRLLVCMRGFHGFVGTHLQKISREIFFSHISFVRFLTAIRGKKSRVSKKSEFYT